jgi:monoamine oxidase
MSGTATGSSASRHPEPTAPGGLTRRRFLAAGGAAAAALALGPLAACGGSKPRREDVVVVGAGLAGLTCAYRLRQAGIDAAVFEARADRVGGRCFTARGFADGQVAEYGGEFIDTNHRRLRALVRELGLTLEDRLAAEGGRPLPERYVFGGRLVGARAVAAGEREFMRRLGVAGRRTNYLGESPHPGARRAAAAFDARTALEWLEASVPGGAGSLLGEALQGYLTSEFGLDPGDLAATAVLYLLEGNAADEDGSDERFHVAGGNDRVTTELAERLAPGTVELDAPMEALWRRDDGYGLEIGGVGEVHADQVVLALPFTTLRDTDFERAGLSALKREAIRDLGMGTNAKVLLQFEERPAAYGGWSGYLATDHPFQYAWETSLAQPGSSGLITVYSGGRDGAALAVPSTYGRAPASVVDDALATLEVAAPGISAGYNRRGYAYNWSEDPWSRGSYAAFLPGQTTRFGPRLKRPEGGIHFAGEHTSIAFQGFLEGAVESGERAAREVQAAR